MNLDMSVHEARRKAEAFCSRNGPCYRCVYANDHNLICALASSTDEGFANFVQRLQYAIIPTRQRVFIDKFPSAKLRDDVLDICPRLVNSEYKCRMGIKDDCDSCRKEYWLSEVEQ